MTAIIHKPCKTATQSGMMKQKNWILEFLHEGQYSIDPIMGWDSSDDMMSSEVRIFFNTKEEAINYATKNNIPYELMEPNPNPKLKPRPYVNNFQFKPTSD